MRPQEIIDFGELLAKKAGVQLPDLTWDWFHWAHEVAQVAKDLEKSRFNNFGPGGIERKKVIAWAKALRKLYENFDQEVWADPLLIYKPINHLGERFHRSQAFLRYARAANRSSKTQTGYCEHAIIHTGRNYGRWYPRGPHRTFIVCGTSFTDYQSPVFEAKFLNGGDGSNPLAPLFPEGGKWLHHYDDKSRTIHLACPDCVEAGKPAKTCNHGHGEIKLFSVENSPKVLEAFTAIAFHFDEHVTEDFLPAALSRIADQAHSCGFITATPLFGPDSWEQEKLASVAEGNPALNRSNIHDPESPPYVEMFQITAAESNIVTPKFIEKWKKSLDPFEIDARIYGKPAPQAKNPVFDREKLARLREMAFTPEYGSIQHTKPLEEIIDTDTEGNNPALFFQEGQGSWKIWFPPEPGAQYIAAVDSARGLTGRDASCCSILRLMDDRGKLKIRLDAQCHGWMQSYDYGFEVFKGAVLYNSALAVIELTGGFGDAVLQVLTRTLGYWNIFRDDMGPDRAEPLLDPRMGVDTNPRTKPFMVGVTQQLLNSGLLEIFDAETIGEAANFEQEVSDSKKTVQFRGAKGARDDRIMSVIIGCYVAMKYPVFDFLSELSQNQKVFQGPDPLADIRDEIRMSDPDNHDPFKVD